MMGSLKLEGSTLGEKQRHYNKLVNDAVKNKITFEAIKDLEETSDIDKLFKIDIASHSRNVKYILETLKSEDMLHVSRAIKQSTWLITDPQYAHIVNPQYLNDVLFPFMMTKSVCKFIFHIRLNLKDQQRVEQFYRYYVEKDQDAAIKWLPHCSIPTIEKAVAKYCEHVKIDWFKRLCERSFSVLKVFNKHYKTNWNKKYYIKSVIFLIQTNTEEFLDIAEVLKDDCGSYCVPTLGRQYTELVMKICPERVLSKFDRYAMAIDIPTFIKHLGKDNIKGFLLKQLKILDRTNRDFKLWFRYKNISKFIKLMPKEGKFTFVQKYFIYKENIADIQVEEKLQINNTNNSPTSNHYKSTDESVYLWYSHGPFDTTFTELTKETGTDSTAEERIVKISVLISCAGNNTKNVQQLLQYFHDRYINEPIVNKNIFFSILLSNTNIHRYDKKCWKILDQLLHSSEIYNESDNCVQNCVEAIILYNVLHDKTVPKVIEKKFNSESTFKKQYFTLRTKDKEKLFKYLFDNLEKKLNKKQVTNINEFNTAFQLLNKMLDLLLDWSKDIHDFPTLIDKIREIIHLKEQNTWEAITTSSVFHKKKSWRKYLFEESLLLSSSEDVCLNALKHDPELLKRYEKQVDLLRHNDKVSLKRLLRKLRIYWPQSLSKEWAKAYCEGLQQPGGLNAVTRGFCTLLPQDELLKVVKKYAPDNSKINWSEANFLQIDLQKNIAKNMHWARPQPPTEAILDYAKGDYLQYALPSICAIFHNMSSIRCQEHISKLLQSPVSLQKHGLRLAFSKLKMNKAKDLFAKIWTSTNNTSIRNIIFQLTHKQLCNETSPDKAEELWQLLEMFLDNLNANDSKKIIHMLGDVNPIPFNIQGKYCLKGYKLLKALSEKTVCGNLLSTLANRFDSLMDRLDPDYIKELLLEHNSQLLAQNGKESRINYIEKLYASYLICADSEETQLERYETILLPLLEHYYCKWETIYQKSSRHSELANLLCAFGFESVNYIFVTKVVPVKLFIMIQKQLEKHFPALENYVLLTSWKLKVIFMECAVKVLPMLVIEETPFHDCKTSTESERYSEHWKKLWTLTFPEFGKQCVQALKDDTARYFSSIYDFFADALDSMTLRMKANFSDLDSMRLDLCEAFVFDKQFVFGHLIAIKIIPMFSVLNYGDDGRRKQLVQKLRDHTSFVIRMYSFKHLSHISAD